MATLCNQEYCTSCMACLNACPFHAISFVENDLSVKVPNIDDQKCKECGLCEKSCPVLNTSLPYNKPIEAIALYTLNKSDRQNCSSGGAATAFAKYFISHGGVVYGATAVNTYPRLIRISTLNQVELLKGSKYVYCDPHLIYQDVKTDLKNGIKCLFIALPCQIAALKQYLHKDYDNLFTVDLICHGTPPFEYLRKHIESKLGEYHSDDSVSFRGLRDFATTIYSSDGSILYSKNRYEDEYFVGFMQGWTNKPGCYKCLFARPERISDITIGDFWGLADDALDNFKGKVSVALINSQKGEILFRASKQSFTWERRTLEEAIKGNSQLRLPTPLTKEAKLFQSAYAKSHSLTNAYKKCGVTRIVVYYKIRRRLLAFPKMILQILNSIKK